MVYFCPKGKKSVCRQQLKVGGRKFSFYLLAGLICIAGVVYISQINRLATMGYEIKSKEKQILTLQEENERLEIEAANLKSAYRFESDILAEGLKKDLDPAVIEIEADSAVALAGKTIN